VRLGLLALVVMVAARQSPPPEPGLRFHHLHLTDDRSPFLLEFYERLFDPAIVRRINEGGTDGLRAGEMLLLIDQGALARSEPTALWHFGWGTVSLGDTYLAHARHEVAWEPPLPANQLHLHVRSVNPAVAAAWYQDRLGARVQMAPPATRKDRVLPPPEHRMPEALVWLGETALLIYRTEPPLFSTRGKQADHIAVTCPDLDAALATLARHGVSILDRPSPRGAWRTAMIEGPDHLAIELVERS
jgi:catechol 2,3-dioxygenase-like lactoylglutathione lyase family enzyme